MQSARIIVFMFIFLSPLWAGNISWNRSLDKALLDAKSSSKLLLVDIYTDWCGWCQKLDENVYTDPKFVLFVKDFIPVKLNAEDNKEGTRWAGAFHVDGYPTLLVIDGHKNIIDRIGGYLEAADLIADISEMRTVVGDAKKYPHDLAKTLKAASLYLDHEMFAEAESTGGSVLKATGLTPDLKQQALLVVGEAQYMSGKYDDALLTLKKLPTPLTDPKREEKVLILLIGVELETENNQEAQKYMKDFMKKYPKSEFAAQVSDLLVQMGTGAKSRGQLRIEGAGSRASQNSCPKKSNS